MFRFLCTRNPCVFRVGGMIGPVEVGSYRAGVEVSPVGRTNRPLGLVLMTTFSIDDRPAISITMIRAPRGAIGHRHEMKIPRIDEEFWSCTGTECSQANALP